MPAAPTSPSWTRIIIVLVAAAVVTGLAVGLLGTIVVLPTWVPSAALGSVVGVLAAFLIWRRRAQPGPAGD